MSKLTKEQVKEMLKGYRQAFDITLVGLTDEAIDLLSEILIGQLNAELAKESAVQDSFEARKAETLTAITNRQPLPEYAKHGSNYGSVFIKYKDKNGQWVNNGLSFYEVIEAVARRVVKKDAQQ